MRISLFLVSFLYIMVTILFQRGKGMKQNKESDYEKQLNIKIEDRLSKMESQDYVFAKPFSKKDYLVVLTVVVFCLVFLIFGKYL